MPATLLDAVTATGAGSAKTVNDDLASAGATHRGILRNFSVVVAYATAAPTSITLKLQGSHDDVSYVDMGNTTDVSATAVGFAVANMPFPYIRGNITAYTAGSCTGVTATCVGSD
jgi:hypothetical protein